MIQWVGWGWLNSRETDCSYNSAVNLCWPWLFLPLCSISPLLLSHHGPKNIECDQSDCLLLPVSHAVLSIRFFTHPYSCSKKQGDVSISPPSPLYSCQQFPYSHSLHRVSIEFISPFKINVMMTNHAAGAAGTSTENQERESQIWHHSAQHSLCTEVSATEGLTPCHVTAGIHSASQGSLLLISAGFKPTSNTCVFATV